MDNKERIENRVIEVSNYLLETKATIREIAFIFKVCKSTIHKDFRERLPLINFILYMEVDEILGYNKAMRAYRGGEATRIKYINKQSENGGGSL
jgi:putative DeoR family transcriptional regulator (stage III sporulation protein D)